MVGTIKFRYQLTGPDTAPPALYLHGFMGSGDDWNGIVGALSDRFRCLAIDLPGHGDTVVAGPDELYRMEPTARALIDLLDSLSVARCHLVGYSMGGRLGWYLALRYPERFDRIVLESTTPGLETATEREERRRHDEALATQLESVPYDRFLTEWYDQPLFASIRRYPERLEAMIASRRRNDPSCLARSLRYSGTGAMPPLWPFLEKMSDGVGRRLLLITGEEDAKFGEIADRVAALVPSVTTAVVPGCGHNVHFEKADEYVSLVRQFLTK